MPPLGILTVSALVALGLFVFGPSGAVTDCTDARTLEFGCHQERYHELVRHSGVQAAFDELQEEREENGFVRAACHLLTHFIGRTAVELYSDLPGAYAHGEPACSSGYYHGATEAIMAEEVARQLVQGGHLEGEPLTPLVAEALESLEVEEQSLQNDELSSEEAN